MSKPMIHVRAPGTATLFYITAEGRLARGRYAGRDPKKNPMITPVPDLPIYRRAIKDGDLELLTAKHYEEQLAAARKGTPPAVSPASPSDAAPVEAPPATTPPTVPTSEGTH